MTTVQPAARMASYTNTSSGLSLTPGGYTAPRQATKMPMRTFEVVGLRPDGSLFIGQDRAPAIALFENAFSAFARGTLVQTATGDIAVEDLQPGDEIVTKDGSTSRLIWVGSSDFVPADAGRRMPLIRVMPDSFGVGRPNSFITLGPAARILQTPYHMRGHTGEGEVLTPLREFVDGVNVIEVVPPTPVRLFHLCLERHAVIKAGGLEMETYHPGHNTLRTTPDVLRDRYLKMFPCIDQISAFGPLAFPRASEEEMSAASRAAS